jgi:membrane protein
MLCELQWESKRAFAVPTEYYKAASQVAAREFLGMCGAFLPAMTLATTRLGVVRWQGWDRIAAILATLGQHRSLGIAAEMSFWLFCAMIPLAVTAVLVSAHLPFKGMSLLEVIVSDAPAAARALVSQEVAGLSSSLVKPSLLYMLVCGWLASSGLHAIYDGFEAQLGIGSPWWKKRMRALLGCLVLSFGVALLALLGAGWDRLSVLAPVLTSRRLGLLLRSIGAVTVLYGLVAGLYRLGIPKLARPQVRLIPGTVAVVLSLTTVGFGYRVYLSLFGDGSAYQAGLAVIVMTLTMLFLFSLAMLLGLAIGLEFAGAHHRWGRADSLQRADQTHPSLCISPQQGSPGVGSAVCIRKIVATGR